MFGRYVDQVLQPGEQVRYHASIHWISYIYGVFWFIAAGVVLLVAPESPRNGFWGLLATLLAAGGVYSWTKAWFVWWITEIAVTNRRVIYKRGFIWRTTTEMNMDKIESVKVDQSILGRILDYGKVSVLGTGQGESLGRIGDPIAAPLELRNHITGV